MAQAWSLCGGNSRCLRLVTPGHFYGHVNRRQESHYHAQKGRDTKTDRDDSGTRPLKRNAMFMRGKVTITRS